jgi:L-malate glycosyltransferase
MTVDGKPPLRLAFLADPNSVHTRRWLSFFVERGHHVDLVVAEEDDVGEALPAGINLRRYPRLGRSRIRYVATLRGRSALRRLLAELRPDLVHAHFLTRYGWQAHLAGFHPFVVTLWGSDVLVAPGRSRRARMWGTRTLRSADAVTAVAPHLAEAAVVLGARRDRLHVVPFGVDTERFGPGRRDPEVARRHAVDGRRLVFSPRALTPLYRHEDILRAVAELPQDVVVLAGARNADPTYLAGLLSLAEELGLRGRFLVADAFEEDELPALFAGAAVAVSVPESDGLPLTVLEAMASATPVVASDLDGPRSCLGGYPQLLVPVGDPPALRRALAGVLELTDSERTALGADLRGEVAARFQRRTHLLRMEAIYRSLVETSGPPNHASRSASAR